MPGYKDITVTFMINERKQEALEELLPFWHKYTKEDGEKPFENCSIDDLFRSIIQAGCNKYISEKIKEEQFRQGMIEAEELLNDEPFRLMKERDEA